MVSKKDIPLALELSNKGITTRNSRYTCEISYGYRSAGITEDFAFMRLLPTHKNPQVMNIFAGVSPAEMFLSSFSVFLHESLGNSAGIPADFHAEFCTFCPAYFAAVFFFPFKIVTF